MRHSRFSYGAAALSNGAAAERHASRRAAAIDGHEGRRGALFLACLLAGCSTVPPSHPNRVSPPEVEAPTVTQSLVEAPRVGSEAAATPATFEIVRYIGVDTAGWKAGHVPQDYSDLYTRIELASTRDTEGAGSGERRLRNYRAENRDWFSRLLSNRTDNVTTLANVTVRDPGLTVAIPLFSLSHASGIKLGNSWNTQFTASYAESPLFRIGPNTALTVHLSARVTSDFKSQGASLAVSAITTAVKIAAPTSPLLTTLSKPEVNNAANAIDTAISSLLSHDISEDIDVGRLGDSWSAGSRIMLYGCAPFVRAGQQPQQPDGGGVCASEPDFHNDQDMLVGKWTLTLSCPRLSAFDVRDICSPLSNARERVAPAADRAAIDLSDPANRAAAFRIVADSVSDAQILGFGLASQIDVATYVQSQPWFTTFAGKSDRQAQDYHDFCYGSVVGLESTGLSRFDSILVLRAMIHQLPQIAGSQWKTQPDAVADCIDLMQKADVTL
ncbi:MAG TPA: hypothetical protein VFW19_17610 [Allosphingosinicella sp.]|nr:hypothetical protein [Allosphingosinicella sp.]